MSALGFLAWLVRRGLRDEPVPAREWRRPSPFVRYESHLDPPADEEDRYADDEPGEPLVCAVCDRIAVNPHACADCGAWFCLACGAAHECEP